jgi:hypothetical protein
VLGQNLNFGGGNFGRFVIFGGLNVGTQTVNFGPGEYVLAGTTDSSMLVWNTDNKATVTGGTGENSDAGRIFILTDGSYNGALDSVRPAGMPQLGFGGWGAKSGNNAQSNIQLFGLNPADANVPTALTHYGPVTIWQDMRNSTVKYNLTDPLHSTYYGDVDWLSCGSGHTRDNPCSTGLPADNREKVEFWAGAAGRFGGIVYQPRGAYTVIHATPTDSGPLRIVTGAMDLQGSGRLTLTGPLTPYTRTVAALVE